MKTTTRLTAIFSTLGVTALGVASAAMAADGPIRVAAPEIDGPAGIGAIALLVSAGIVAYRRFSK